MEGRLREVAAGIWAVPMTLTGIHSGEFARVGPGEVANRIPLRDSASTASSSCDLGCTYTKKPPASTLT